MRDPKELIGKQVTFDHDGRRLSGVVTESASTGLNPRGSIPDYTLAVRGASGRIIRLGSAVDSYVSVKE